MMIREDKVRMVRVSRLTAYAWADPHGVKPSHPSPLSAPYYPSLSPGTLSVASGTSRVPAPWGRLSGLRPDSRHPQLHHPSSASFHLIISIA